MARPKSPKIRPVVTKPFEFTVKEDGRGYRWVDFPNDGTKTDPKKQNDMIVGEASAISTKYDDAFDNPGSSFLYIGRQHRLDREEVKQLIDVLKYWLENKLLPETMEAVKKPRKKKDLKGR